MSAQRFIQSYKCDCFQPYNYCNCPYKSDATEVLVANVKEVAQTLVEVMKLCFIPATKAVQSMDVVIYYFLHFEEIRHRIDSVPKKRIFKEDLFHDLHQKCNMTRMESQITYSIVKRAFRAFYHGTAEGGVPNPLLRSQLIHSPECMWCHASKRTAQIFATYEGLFMATQKDIECKIKQLYKALYDRINQTALDVDGNHECVCAKCAKRIMRESLKTVRVTTGMHNITDPYEALYREIVDKMRDVREKDLGNGFANLSTTEARNCTCPTLKMLDSDYMYRNTAESCKSGYSQGPFDCHWAPISKEEYEADDADPVIELPEVYPCPPCEEGQSSCESECACNCEVCTCRSDAEYECFGESIEDDVETSLDIEQEEEAPSNTESVTKLNKTIDEKEFSIKYSGCKDPTEALKMITVHFTRDSHQSHQNSRKLSRSKIESEYESFADHLTDTNNHVEKC